MGVATGDAVTPRNGCEGCVFDLLCRPNGFALEVVALALPSSDTLNQISLSWVLHSFMLCGYFPSLLFLLTLRGTNLSGGEKKNLPASLFCFESASNTVDQGPGYSML